MILAIKILLLCITIVWFIGSIGEENQEWRNKYFFGSITLVLLLIMVVKYL